MATKKFAVSSPYAQESEIPDTDYRYKKFVESLQMKSRPKSEPVVVAMFGLGRAGSIHLSNLLANPRVIVKYIIDDDGPGKWTNLRTYWNLKDDVIFLTSKDSEKVYKDKTVTAVVVASPTVTHESIVINSLDNGKHVFCEKPIAGTIEGTQKCYEKAKASGKKLFAAFNRRFDPAFRGLMERVRAGEVGHAQLVRVTARDGEKPSVDYLKISGGIFHDSMVHDIDITTWLLGELPIKVQATGTALVSEIKAIDDYDNVSYMMTFPSGAISVGDNSRFSSYGYDQRMEVFGNKGMIRVDNERPSHSTDAIINKNGVKYNPIYYTFASRYKEAYANEMEQFLDVAQYGVEPDVKSWQTFATSTIATALEKSARTGETVYLDWSKYDIPANYS